MTDEEDFVIDVRAVIGLASSPETVNDGVRFGVFKEFYWNADRDDLIRWTGGFPEGTRFKAIVSQPAEDTVFMVPGEPKEEQ